MEAASGTWPIAVFAHNEEKHIVACLESLYSSAGGEQGIQIFVLANGCTDLTEQAVIEYGRTHREVNLISIKLGDKANAWNLYVHEIAPDQDIHFIIDGDVEACPEALSRLHTTLCFHPEAHAVAAFPTSAEFRKMAKDDTERSLSHW